MSNTPNEDRFYALLKAHESTLGGPTVSRPGGAGDLRISFGLSGPLFKATDEDHANAQASTVKEVEPYEAYLDEAVYGRAVGHMEALLADQGITPAA